jgi:very-short-patch-repair endonuclease
MDLLQVQCKALGIKIPETEYRFHSIRKWRTDYFFANVVRGKSLAVEIEGGIYTRGRHTRGKGAEKDMEKYNELSIKGIYLLRFTPDQVRKGIAALTIQRWIYEHS